MFILTLVIPELEGEGIAFLFVAIFTAAGFLLKVKSKETLRLKQKKEELGAIAYARVHHVEGLPLAEKTECELFLTNDKLVIEGGGSAFNLSLSQIRAAEVKTDTEIANIVQGSLAGGVVGGLVFGPVGAIIGSRAKSHEKRSYSYYLVINYTNSKGEIAAMLFDGGKSSEGKSPFSIQKIVLKIKTLTQDNVPQSVQL
jgi:hypothetical protein